MANILERDWLTIKEAAAVANLSRKTLVQYMKLRKGKPPAYRLVPNGRWRFPTNEFVAWTKGEKDKQNV
jgi:excisionase family DNA binding protein